MERRDTVGKLSSELLQKDTVADVTPNEQMRESLGDFEQLLLEAVAAGKVEYTGDFYVVVLTRNPKLMPNVLQLTYHPRKSCPTPHHDQVVYKYHSREERIEFLWVVPDKNACQDLKANALNLDPALRDLLQYVLDFSDGTLDKKALVLNGEIV